MFGFHRSACIEALTLFATLVFCFVILEASVLTLLRLGSFRFRKLSKLSFSESTFVDNGFLKSLSKKLKQRMNELRISPEEALRADWASLALWTNWFGHFFSTTVRTAGRQSIRVSDVNFTSHWWKKGQIGPEQSHSVGVNVGVD